MTYFTDIASLAIALGLIAVATEASLEIIKKVFTGLFTISANVAFAISAIIACLFTVLMQISIFDKSQVPFVIYALGQLLAGLIASRGSNRVHEILDAIKKLKK